MPTEKTENESSSSRTIISIVDDDPIFCDTIAGFLRTRRWNVDIYSSAADYLARGTTARVECLVSDICMPNMSGLELQEELKNRGAKVPIIFVSGRGDVPTAVEAIRRGAFDFLIKPVSGTALITKIKDALSFVVSPVPLSEIHELATRWQTLLPREAQLTNMLVSGMSNKAMSQDLGLSLRSIESCRSQVMKKMQAKSLAQLVQMAVRLGEQS